MFLILFVQKMLFENKKWRNQVLLMKYPLKYEFKTKSYFWLKIHGLLLINVKNDRLLHFEAYE